MVLEKCEMDLSQELQNIKNDNKQSFEESKLLNMIFDLLDGLITFQLYNIIHCDIKPSSILINKQGRYIYSNINFSQTVLPKIIKPYGFTEYQASPEQMKYEYNSNNPDVFSLGKTLEQYIDDFQALINTYMFGDNHSERKNCLELHEMFFQYVKKNKQFLDLYIAKLNGQKQLIPQTFINKIFFFQQQNYYIKICAEISKDKSGLPQQEYLLNCLLNLGEYEQSIIQQNQIFQCLQKVYSNHENNFISYCLVFTQKHKEYNCLNQMYENLENKLKELSSKPNQQDYSYYTTYNNFGFILYNMKDYHQAIANLKKSIEIQTIKYEKSLHLDLVITQFNIAFCYRKLKDYQTANEYCSKSYSDFQKIIQKENPYFIYFLNLIGTCYYNLQDYSKAKYNFEISQKIAEQFDLKNLLILSLKNQSQCCIKQKNFDLAIKNYLTILPIQEKQLGKYHTKIADLQQIIAYCYFQLTQYNEAIEFAGQSYQIYLLNKNKVKQQQQQSFIIKCLNQIEAQCKQLEQDYFKDELIIQNYQNKNLSIL